MKKKYIIVVCFGLFLIFAVIFIYNQMKVKSIFVDIDYSKSSYFTSIMKFNQDDRVLVTLDSKIKLTSQISDVRLLNKRLKWISSNENIINFDNNDLIIKGTGEAEIYCKSILGTKSNIIKFTVVEEEI